MTAKYTLEWHPLHAVGFAEYWAGNDQTTLLPIGWVSSQNGKSFTAYYQDGKFSSTTFWSNRSAAKGYVQHFGRLVRSGLVSAAKAEYIAKGLSIFTRDNA